jgi:hypothetical protein
MVTGLKKICEKCSGDKFNIYVSLDLADFSYGCTTEAPIKFQCVGCGAIFEVFPEPKWRVELVHLDEENKGAWELVTFHRKKTKTKHK